MYGGQLARQGRLIIQRSDNRKRESIWRQRKVKDTEAAGSYSRKGEREKISRECEVRSLNGKRNYEKKDQNSRDTEKRCSK